MLPELDKIKMILMDVDGVMTDGKLIYSSDGKELKEFNIQDGMGITLAREAGLKTGIITARKSEIVQRRAAELNYDVVEQGSSDKIKVYETSLHNRVILLADDHDIGGNFPADSEDIAALIPS